MNGSLRLVLTAPVSAACRRPLVLPGCDRDGDARTRKVGHVFNERLVDVDDGENSIDPSASGTDQVRIGDRSCDQGNSVARFGRILGIDHAGPGTGGVPIGILEIAAQAQ